MSNTKKYAIILAGQEAERFATRAEAKTYLARVRKEYFQFPRLCAEAKIIRIR